MWSIHIFLEVMKDNTQYKGGNWREKPGEYHKLEYIELHPDGRVGISTTYLTTPQLVQRFGEAGVSEAEL